MQLIVSIDPGAKYTGMVIHCSPGTIKLEHYAGFQNYADAILQQIDYGFDAHRSVDEDEVERVVIIEDFILYKHKADVQSFQQMKTSELVGIIEKHCLTKGYKVVRQRAAQAKIWTNKRIKYLNLLEMPFIAPKSPKPDRHGMDAYRHFLYYLNKEQFKGFISDASLKDYVIDVLAYQFFRYSDLEESFGKDNV